MIMTMGVIRHYPVVIANPQVFSFLMILDVVLFVVMIAFNCWNWYLALVGYSTIEWWTECLQEPAKDKQYHKFPFNRVNDNLFKVFGTYKLFRVLSPSMRNVPFTGLEWAFLMRDLGYSQ